MNVATNLAELINKTSHHSSPYGVHLSQPTLCGSSLLCAEHSPSQEWPYPFQLSQLPPSMQHSAAPHPYMHALIAGAVSPPWPSYKQDSARLQHEVWGTVWDARMKQLADVQSKNVISVYFLWKCSWSASPCSQNLINVSPGQAWFTAIKACHCNWQVLFPSSCDPSQNNTYQGSFCILMFYPVEDTCQQFDQVL